MIQKQITHPAGTFSACACCRKEPRHIRSSGRTSREAVFSSFGDRHQLETACGRRTGWHSTLDEAEQAWGQLGETLPLPLPAAKTTNVRPLRARVQR